MMTRHVASMAGVILVAMLAIAYPFLPGKHDPLANPLSIAIQLFAAASLLLVPIGVVWLIAELRSRSRGGSTPIGHRGIAFVALIASAALSGVLSLLVLFAISVPLGILALAICGVGIARWYLNLRRHPLAPGGAISMTSIYLIVVPVALLLLQVALFDRLTKFSRDRAIAHSQEIIREIERHRAERGNYPETMEAMWKDYEPGVIGVEKYHYAPNGESYNLFFEQPRFLFDNVGTREWVVYDPRDEQRMISHASWFLLLSPSELQRHQGWYAVHETNFAHWKRFEFD